MKKKFIIAALVAITIKGCLIYMAFRASSLDKRSWKMSRKASVVNDIPGESMLLLSPVFKVNNIYRSMQGPVSGHGFMIDSSAAEIVWITGYSVEVTDEWQNKKLSDDFICHNNLDFNLKEHHQRWGTEHRIDDTYPRLITLTQGQTSLRFPKGFGFPVFSNEPMSVLTQVLNHNLPDANLHIKHRTRIEYIQHERSPVPMKPLFERSIFVMLPFDEDNPGRLPDDPKGCIPVDPRNHRYLDTAGAVYSGHWVMAPGKHRYRFNVTKMMNLPFDTRIHYAGVHTHPFTEWLQLKDLDTDSIIFTASCKNFRDKTGLEKIEHFSSENGIPVFKTHQYELIVKVNNTSGEDQDMMASMFLYFYDPVIDNILKEKL